MTSTQKVLAASLLASIVSLSSTSQSVASDFGTPGTWSGVYVGIHGGMAWQDGQSRFDSGGDDTRASLELDGGLVGVHTGYRAQWGQVVLGVAGDYSARIDADSTFRNDAALASFDDVTLDPKNLWSVRGEIGYAFRDLLVYGTIGYGSARYDVRSVTPFDSASGSVSTDEGGLVYGAGIEWKLASNLALGATYLHYDVGKNIDIADGALPDSDTGDFARFDDIDVFRVSLTFQLDTGHRRMDADAPLK